MRGQNGNQIMSLRYRQRSIKAQKSFEIKKSDVKRESIQKFITEN